MDRKHVEVAIVHHPVHRIRDRLGAGIQRHAHRAKVSTTTTTYTRRIKVWRGGGSRIEGRRTGPFSSSFSGEHRALNILRGGSLLKLDATVYHTERFPYVRQTVFPPFRAQSAAPFTRAYHKTPRPATLILRNAGFLITLNPALRG